MPHDLGLPGGPTAPGAATGPPPGVPPRAEDLPDDCKLYVASLTPSVTDSMLRSHFGLFGEVNYAVVITDKQTGVSRGFGFVHYNDA